MAGQGTNESQAPALVARAVRYGWMPLIALAGTSRGRPSHWSMRKTNAEVTAIPFLEQCSGLFWIHTNGDRLDSRRP